MKSSLWRILTSPTLQFLLLGGLIFAIYSVARTNADSDARPTLVVTADELALLEAGWVQRWNRPPTPEERQGLIDNHIRQTVLYREALDMGLDKNDIVIQRRLAQKLEFLFQDLADSVPPTSDDLQNYFEDNLSRFRGPDLMTFSQVFIDPDKRGDETLEDAEAIRASLAAGMNPAEDAVGAGDRIMLQNYYPQRSELDVGKLFGAEFARSLFEQEPEQWRGPILSGYGVHVVYIHDRTQPPDPELDMVMEQVTMAWKAEQRQRINDEFVKRLMERYEIRIEEASPAQIPVGS